MFKDQQWITTIGRTSHPAFSSGIVTSRQCILLGHRDECVGANAFADLSFISAAAISAGCNSAGCATRSRDPLRLLSSVLALPRKPYRLAFPPPVKVPSEGASERPADSFRCAAYGDIQIQIRCLLKAARIFSIHSLLGLGE